MKLALQTFGLLYCLIFGCLVLGGRAQAAIISVDVTDLTNLEYQLDFTYQHNDNDLPDPLQSLTFWLSPAWFDQNSVVDFAPLDWDGLVLLSFDINDDFGIDFFQQTGLALGSSQIFSFKLKSFRQLNAFTAFVSVNDSSTFAELRRFQLDWRSTTQPIAEPALWAFVLLSMSLLIIRQRKLD